MTLNIYENFRAACKRNGTTLTEVLNATGHSSGSTGTWKQGRPPKLDIVMEIADYLHISLDELVYGKEAADEMSRCHLSASLRNKKNGLMCCPVFRKKSIPCVSISSRHIWRSQKNMILRRWDNLV